MATPKKNTTTKDALHALPIALKSSNGDEFPIAYCDNIWDIVAAQSKLIGVLGSIGQYDQHTINEALAELAIPTVEADLEYDLSVTFSRKEGSHSDEVSNVTTQLVDFDFANSAVPNVNFARIKVNVTANITLIQHDGTTQSATYHTESYGLFSKMRATMEGVSEEGVWVQVIVPAYEYIEFPTNIELIGVGGRYMLYNDFGTILTALYQKADKADCASQADIDYLQAAIERVDSSIPQNVSDLQDGDDYVKGSDLATVATTGDYSDLQNTPTIPENISDLNNDSNFVESSDLATVATTGSYDDLQDKPDLSDYATQADIDYLQGEIDECAIYARLATVATSGSYDDLDDKPSIPENISDLNNDSNFVESSDLATVATSGSYDDLEDKPDLNGFVESSDLATVATSGSYDDLQDKPDLSGYAEQADIDYLQAAIEDLGNCAKHYVFVCKNYAETTSATILAENHGCGLYPIVSCYSGGQQVAVDIALNEYGDITVGWKNAADVTPQNPMTISVVGASEITAEEEMPD